METTEWVGFFLTLIVMLVGLAGSILPGIPSTPIVFIAALGHRLLLPESGVATWVLVTLGLFMGLALAMDYLATVYGTRKFGATWRGTLGALVGGMIGLFFNIPGLILGPFLGAVVGELIGGRAWKDSAKAGVGAWVGLLAGAVGKFTCCLVMIGLFILGWLNQNVF